MRHADAGDRATWTGDDRRRPLSTKGRAQATWLVARLAPYALTQLASSPYLRCAQTLEPLAGARGLAVAKDPLLAEGEPARRCLALLARPGAVACTHGDVVEAVLAALRKRGLRMPRDGRTPKGGIWIVDDTRVRFIAPA